MTDRKQTELADRLEVLGIEAAELAAMIRRPVEEVETWIEGSAEADAEAQIHLRIIFDPARAHAAELAAQRVRDIPRTMPLRSTGDWQAAGIEPPYGGGHEGTTGGTPS